MNYSKRKREPQFEVPSRSKEVVKNCGIASRTNPTYLPFIFL